MCKYFSSYADVRINWEIPIGGVWNYLMVIKNLLNSIYKILNTLDDIGWSGLNLKRNDKNVEEHS